MKRARLLLKINQDHAPRSYSQQKSRFKKTDIYVNILIISWFSIVRRPSKTLCFRNLSKLPIVLPEITSGIFFENENNLCHDLYHYCLTYAIFEKLDNVINTIDFVIKSTCLVPSVNLKIHILILPPQYNNAFIFV